MSDCGSVNRTLHSYYQINTCSLHATCWRCCDFSALPSKPSKIYFHEGKLTNCLCCRHYSSKSLAFYVSSKIHCARCITQIRRVKQITKPSSLLSKPGKNSPLSPARRSIYPLWNLKAVPARSVRLFIVTCLDLGLSVTYLRLFVGNVSVCIQYWDSGPSKKVTYVGSGHFYGGGLERRWRTLSSAIVVSIYTW